MKCDIIIPVWNQLGLTRDCIEYLFKNTRYPFRLIIIDNGSEKEVYQYLKKLSQARSEQLTLIRNEANLGYVKAINQGLKISEADYICLLNNDTRVDNGWLQELIKAVQSDQGIGIMNPGGFPGSYRKKELSGKWMEIGFATGFCMLIKREIIRKIGFLDEIYGIGYWEDTDYCQRAKKMGYICAASQAAYVFHHAKSTFNLFKKGKVNELFERNKNIFYKKWGKILRVACVIFEQDIDNKWIDELLRLARQGHLVHLILKKSANMPAGTKKVYMRKFRYPDILFGCWAAFKIIHRRRKKFDSLLTDNPKFAARASSFVPGLKVDLV